MYKSCNGAMCVLYSSKISEIIVLDLVCCIPQNFEDYVPVLCETCHNEV